jgi:tape measure domain-containing protein
MSSVDSRIVTMKFDNVAFERGIATTISTLGKLKASLDLGAAASKATSGLGGISTALSKVTGDPFKAAKVGLGNLTAATTIFSRLNPFSRATTGAADLGTAASNTTVGVSGIGGTISGVSTKFMAMATIGVTALSTVVSSAISAGTDIAKSLTIDPITAGLSEYETNLNSIQTIMANTSMDGTTLHDVEGALEELNTYSDKTIYNFAEMAKNIGTFTAAGVDLDTSTEAIKGIANLAAVSGSNSQQASTAMYQLSQGLAAGKVTLMDWNSVVNAGMGGEVFQQALMDTARIQGVNVDAMVKKAGSFRASLEQGWITSDVLTGTLSKFTGDMTAAQLKEQGYTDEDIKGILEMGVTATEAATKVKTATALLDTLKETVGSGWSKSWSLILGDFEEAKEMFTNVNDILGGILGRSAEARNKVLEDWNKLGGRKVMIEGVANAWKALMRILGPIRRAFREVFPAKTGKDLFSLTKMFRDFTEGLIANKPVMKTIRSVFTALFSVLGLGIDVIKALVGYFVVDFIQLFTGGKKGVLSFIRSIADMVTQFVTWMREGDKVGAFFQKLGETRHKIISPIIKLIYKLLGSLGTFLSSVAKSASAALVSLSKKVMPFLGDMQEALQSASDTVRSKLIKAFGILGPILEDVKDNVRDALAYLMNMGGSLGGTFEALKNLFDIGSATDTATEGIDKVRDALTFAAPAASTAKREVSGFADFLKGIGVFLGGIALAIGDGISAAWTGTGDALSGFGGSIGGIWDGIKEIFGTIKDKFISYLGDLGFNEGLALVNTGFFIALYMMLRSFVGKFSTMVKTITGTFDSFTGVLDQVTSNLKTMQTDVRSNIILKIAAAIALLAAALYVLSKIDAEGLKRGLAAVAALMLMLVAALIKLEKTSTFTGALQMSALSLAMIGLGVGLLAMSVALAVIGRLDPEELKQGLIAVGLVLTGITAMTAILGASGGGATLIAASIAIGLLSVALTAFAQAVKLYAKYDVEMLKDGGLKIVAMLAALGLVMHLMPPHMIASAAALLILANALMLISVAMTRFAGFSPAEISTSLKMLGGSLLIIGAAMILMSHPGVFLGSVAMIAMATAIKLLIPSLERLGNMDPKKIAIALIALIAIFAIIGGTMALLAPIAPALFILSKAFLFMGLAVVAVGAGLLLFAAGLAALAASGLAGFAVLTAIVIGFIQMFPLIAQQIGLGMVAFGLVLKDAAPKLIEGLGATLRALAEEITKSVPAVAAAITALLLGIFQIIRDAYPELVKTGWVIIKSVLGGIKDNLPSVIPTVGRIIVTFFKALTTWIPKIVSAGVTLLVSFLTGIWKGLNRIVPAVADIIETFLLKLADNLPRIITAGFKLLMALLSGIRDNLEPILKAGIAIVTNIIKGIGENMQSIIDAGFNLLINFLNGLATAIRENEEEIRDAGWNVATAIIEGVVNGLDAMSDWIVNALMNIVSEAWDEIVDFLIIGSPSKKMHWLGEMVAIGMADGINAKGNLSAQETEKMGIGVVGGLKKGLRGMDELAGLDANPRITPVLDLTKFQRDARTVDDLMAHIRPIKAEVSASRARAISSADLANRENDRQEETPKTEHREFKFEQHNHSPKALSAVEIYRQTKNQLSLAKEALGVR